jgi:hypothetical protein
MPSRFAFFQNCGRKSSLVVVGVIGIVSVVMIIGRFQISCIVSFGKSQKGITCFLRLQVIKENSFFSINIYPQMLMKGEIIMFRIDQLRRWTVPDVSQGNQLALIHCFFGRFIGLFILLVVFFRFAAAALAMMMVLVVFLIAFPTGIVVVVVVIVMVAMRFFTTLVLSFLFLSAIIITITITITITSLSSLILFLVRNRVAIVRLAMRLVSVSLARRRLFPRRVMVTVVFVLVSVLGSRSRRGRLALCSIPRTITVAITVTVAIAVTILSSSSTTTVSSSVVIRAIIVFGMVSASHGSNYMIISNTLYVTAIGDAYGDGAYFVVMILIVDLGLSLSIVDCRVTVYPCIQLGRKLRRIDSVGSTAFSKWWLTPQLSLWTLRSSK